MYVLPKVLKATMLQRGLTFKELSALSGVNLKTLYHWSSGQSPRGIVQVYRVAVALGLSIEQLAFGDAAPPPIKESYELVLYRVSSEDLREKLCTIKDPSPAPRS